MTFHWLPQGFRRRVLAHGNAGKAELLWFPVQKRARIALLDADFRETAEVRRFAVNEMSWLLAWRPEALVLPLDLALSLSDQKRRGLFDLPSLDAAIVVLTSFDDSPLADHHRDMLWTAFGVPVFEQLLGSDGTVIASECEVHDGLHLRANEPFFLDGEVVTEQCACGLETPRLRRPTGTPFTSHDREGVVVYRRLL
jgi:hypothetical protein